MLIRRKFPPIGWALPGGFVEEGETIEEAIIREVKEETNLDFSPYTLLYVYSSPKRDPRKHTISAVFIGKGEGKLQQGDDASLAQVFSLSSLPSPIVFDHEEILKDYLLYKEKGILPDPRKKISQK